MPVKFDPDLLSVCVVGVKSVSTALGGSIRIKDEANPLNSKGLIVDVPFHLVRKFKKAAGDSKFLRPNHAELIVYDGHPICFERFPYQQHIGDDAETLNNAIEVWSSRCQRIFDNCVIPWVESHSVDHDWYIDGYYVYSLPKDRTKWVEESAPLNESGTFRRLRVTGFKVSDFAWSANPTTAKHTELHMSFKDCLVYNAPDGNAYITPPIWNHLGQVGSKKVSGTGDAVDNTLFDYIDERLHVNISFALDVATRITDVFGYESIEALQLPELMILYRTVNLQKLPKAVKETGDCGMTFTHTLSWLCGLFRDPEQFDQMLNYRQILKYLTTKGLQNSGALAMENIYQEDFLQLEDNSVATLSVEEIKELMAA